MPRAVWEVGAAQQSIKNTVMCCRKLNIACVICYKLIAIVLILWLTGWKLFSCVPSLPFIIIITFFFFWSHLLFPQSQLVPWQKHDTFFFLPPLIHPPTALMGCDGPLASRPSNCHFSWSLLPPVELSVVNSSWGGRAWRNPFERWLIGLSNFVFFFAGFIELYRTG